MKAAITAGLIAAAVAGCGGGDKQQTTAAPPVASTPTATQTLPSTTPTATTNTPPTQHRTTPQPSSTQPLQVGTSYKCGGKPLKAIKAQGPIKVKPPVVKPGQSFAVTITDPSVKVALVSLAGVAPKPIQGSAKEQHGQLTATLKMPGYAGCGNKLLEIEGDISAEAYVGVSD